MKMNKWISESGPVRPSHVYKEKLNLDCSKSFYGDRIYDK